MSEISYTIPFAASYTVSKIKDAACVGDITPLGLLEGLNLRRHNYRSATVVVDSVRVTRPQGGSGTVAVSIVPATLSAAGLTYSKAFTAPGCARTQYLDKNTSGIIETMSISWPPAISNELNFTVPGFHSPALLVAVDASSLTEPFQVWIDGSVTFLGVGWALAV